MTAIELINILKDCPETMKILVNGYETGYDDITSVDEAVVFYEDNVDWWNGNYEDVEFKKVFRDISEDEIEKNSISVMIIRGKNR